MESGGSMVATRSIVTLCTLGFALFGCSGGGDSGGSADAGNASFDAPMGVDSTNAQGSPDSGEASTVTEASAPADAQSAGDGATADADAAVTDCASDGGVPAELRCTGLYSDWASQTIAPDVNYYDPGYKLWSDGAVKRRWIRLPPQTQIDTTDMDNWVFPVGTKIWKEFNLGGQVVAGGKVVGGKIIETRLLWKDSAAHWTIVVYRWSDDQTSTHSITAGEKVHQPDGGPDYEIPSVFMCKSCHGGRTDLVLGFDLIGLGVPGAGATGGLTLSTLPQGWLTQPPPATTIQIPDDATMKAVPALGFLHMNCGVSCHNAMGPGSESGLYTKLLAAQLYPPGGANAAVTSLDTYTTAVNVPGRLGPGYMRIAPGDSAHSLVPLMALARDPDAGALKPMPPLVSHRADTNPATGVPLVQAWIDAL